MIIQSKEKTETQEDSPKTEHLLEEYKLFVQMMDSNSNRRNTVNRFYLTVIASTYFVFPMVMKEQAKNYYILGLIGLLGSVLCLVWFLTLHEFRVLNRAKFRVISDLEKKLPFGCYNREYEYLKHEKYRPLSKFEQCISAFLTLPYLVLLGYSIFRIFAG